MNNKIIFIFSIAIFIIISLIVWAVIDDAKNGPFLTTTICINKAPEDYLIILNMTQTKKNMFGTTVKNSSFAVKHCE